MVIGHEGLHGVSMGFRGDCDEGAYGVVGGQG